MTFLNDLWNKFKAEGKDTYPGKASQTKMTNQGAASVQDMQPSPTSNIKTTLENFESVEMESLQRETVHTNLSHLKTVVDQPKEEKLELRFTKIKQHLGEPEVHETVRQERWPEHIHCPNCNSRHLKRLPQISGSPHNHRYQCLDCATTFNDDSDTPLEKSLPPLHIWMQCWYLIGCTDSLTYIAAKLNLDISMVEHMVQQLQKLFHAQKPLTRLMGFEEWDKQSSHLREQLKEDLLRQYEQLNANLATAPKDTAEFRRQQNIRRGVPTIEPPSPTPGRKR